MACAATGNRVEAQDGRNLRAPELLGMDESAIWEQEFLKSECLVRRAFEANRLHSRPFSEWLFRVRACSDLGCAMDDHKDKPCTFRRFGFRRDRRGRCDAVPRPVGGERLGYSCRDGVRTGRLNCEGG